MDQEQTQADEFDAAFKEAVQARSGGSPEPEPAPPAPAEAEASQPQSESSAHEQPADSGQAPAEPPSAAAPPPPKTEEELAKLRKELDDAKHRERSASNRIPALQRELEAARKKLEDLQAAAEKPPPPEDLDLQAAMREMPELAPVVEKLVAQRVAAALGTVTKDVQTVKSVVEPLQQRAEKDALEAELAVVAKEYPDWRDIVYSQEFESWTQSLPPALRQAYAGAKTGADALAFLRMYRPKAETPPASPAPAPAADPNARLLRAVGPSSRPAAAPVTGMPAQDDFDGAFKYFARKRA